MLVVMSAMLIVECNVYFPENIRVMKGESVALPKGFAYTLEVSGDTEINGDYDATVKLLGFIPVKEVTVNVVPETMMSPSGKAVGIKMFTKGLICVGTQSLQSVSGENYNIAKGLNIQQTDIIISANGEELHTVEQFSQIVEASEGNPVTLVVLKNGVQETKIATPIKTKEGYRLGLWVRDSTAGIGTITFVNPENGNFAALGHPITDVDTGILMPVDKGSITNAEIIDVKKGTKGEPGELYGVFASGQGDCGVITKNTEQGIYGRLLPDAHIPIKEPVPVASKNQVKTGKAQVYANVSGNNVESYDLEIQKIMRYAPDDKNLIVKITDERLLNITGGIVQGMSGSPIIQDGKLVGAVTHVFVNDPTRGYGIFIENMLAEAEKIK